MNLPILGAWLHDIGKFAQRAKARRSDLEHEYCKFNQDRYTHQHVLYTDYFIEHTLPLPEELEGMRSFLAGLAASHHKADGKSREHRAIQRADGLSAGMDRTEAEQEGDFIRARMDSIFSKVKLGSKGVDAAAPCLQYSLAPLGEKDSIFPVQNAHNDGSYKTLWTSFIAELEQIPRNLGVKVWQATLISLLERYCWCIPSATWRSLPDVSLYDHSATTAALTQAILGCEPGKEKFLLFGGDLSGIQTFIFGREEPADKGATRLLRARSFILQAVSRSLWLALLDRLKLDFSAKIMDSGGHFILLLPDTQLVRDQISALEYEAEEWLFNNFQGAVRINFASLAIKEKDLAKENFSACFEKFNELLEDAKLHPFSRLIAHGHSTVIENSHSDYARFGECEYCHTRPATDKDGNKPICTQCRQLQRLGSRLPGANFIVFTRQHINGSDAFSGMLFDNINIRICQERPSEVECRHALDILSIRNETIFTTSPIAGYIPLITSHDLQRWQSEGRVAQSNGELLFKGEECLEGMPKTFTMLAEEARIPPASPADDHWEAIPLLGVCKADVDNLGLVFSLGLTNRFSLSCYAMLARMLNYFFSGYLIRLIREDFANIYVVFAGGDDVFVIGPWLDIISFSQRMANDFRKFCGENPAVTISAGLPLIKPGLPMRAMREEAEELLQKSKSYDNGSKDALTLFGISTHWKEAQKLLDRGKWLAEITHSGFISRGFLRRLLHYSRECKDFLLGKKLAQNGLYLSHFRYDLARNFNIKHGRPLPDSAAQDANSNLSQLQSLPQDSKQFAQLEMGIAWAIYRTRI